MNFKAVLVLLLIFTGSLLTQNINFGVSDLKGADIIYPTSLQFGPDGRLYLSQVDGTIKVFTITRNGKDDYSVTKVETILLIKKIPNHNDDGKLNDSINKRQITGILVVGTASNPIIYVSSSDPRVGAGINGGDVNLDTNSGIISRLTWNGTTWIKIDLVRGLPRSEENHSPNGMQLDKANNILYLSIGGHTNMGALSTNLAYLPEYALSSAVLSIDLNVIGNSTYDLPTLDDEDRPGNPDENDPFGGNDGKNQAIIVTGGPVQVYSPGYRNPYDLLITQSGRMYTFDNGPNAGWGGAPVNCVWDTVEGGKTYPDGLHYISGKGYYGGHPNLTRANRENTFNANGQSPIPVGTEDPRQCTYLIPGVEDDALTTIGASTNGLAEYTASNFNNAMKGNLIAASIDDKIYRIQLSGDGKSVITDGKTVLFSNFGRYPLDVTTQGDDEIFPGTIWVVNFIGKTITVFEPNDSGICDISDPDGDADGDGYTNKDEADNSTDPCSPASIPEDWDKDHISDLNDEDDDNDLIADVIDKYAVDPDNGTTTHIPTIYTWNNGELSAGAILNTGFTGLMINGSSNYKDLYDPDKMTSGGAAGVLTIDEVSEGDAFGNINNQEYGFQFGVNTSDYTGSFVVHTRINAPFAGMTPQGNQSMGIFIGTGDQDNYLKICAAANNGSGGLEVLLETSGSPTQNIYGPAEGVSILNSSFIDIYLTVDPSTNLVQPSFSVNAGEQKNIGQQISIPAGWLSFVLAVGIISTSRGDEPVFPNTWDSFEVTPIQSSSAAYYAIIPPYSSNNTYNQSTYNPHSFRIKNNSTNGQKITKVTIDLSTSIFPDMVFDINGKAGDIVGKKFTPDSNATVVGYTNVNYLKPHDDGYDALEINFSDFNPGELFTFSIDVDPTSIRGAGPGGPRNSGSVSGVELVGSTAKIEFDDKSLRIGQPFRIPNSRGGSQNNLSQVYIQPPVIEIVGQNTTPAIVTNSSQVVRVLGAAGATVRLLIVEGGLFTANVPNGGFDLDPFEANSLININEYSGQINSSGVAEIPVILTMIDPDSAGLNYITAVIDDGQGNTSDISNVIILQLKEQPLSVELQSFDAVVDGFDVHFNWNSTSDENLNGFEIYRSSVANSKILAGEVEEWTKVASIPAKYSSSYNQYSFTDNVYSGAGKYIYKLMSVDRDGDHRYLKEIEVYIYRTLSYSLSQNYPNPFNPVTKLQFSIPVSGNVRLTVYDVLGQVVKILIDDNREAGTYQVSFNPDGLDSGIYFYKLESGSFSQVRKMIFLK